jgi:hypothetical protein
MSNARSIPTASGRVRLPSTDRSSFKRTIRRRHRGFSPGSELLKKKLMRRLHLLVIVGKSVLCDRHESIAKDNN